MSLSIRKNPAMAMIVALTVASSVGLQLWLQLFNNFAVEQVGCGAVQVGAVQSVREIPGLLAFLAVYCLLLLREQHLAAVAVMTLGVGLAATGFATHFPILLLVTLVMSFGFHYYEATGASLILQYFTKDQAPHVFGKQNSIAALCNVGVAVTLFFVSRWCPYRVMYAVGGAVVIAVGFWAWHCKVPHEHLPRQHKHVVLRREYWLFYLLNVLCGARRQIFIVFSIFLLVKLYNFTLTQVSMLYIVNNLITWQFAPYVAKGIARFGEKKMLTLEYASLMCVFMGYAFFKSPWAIAGLYIVDNMFFGFSSSLRTYFQKIARPEDIASSSMVSSTINHLCAVVLPVVGGLVWLIDYRIPFVAGAVLSCCSLIAVQQMRTFKRVHA